MSINNDPNQRFYTLLKINSNGVQTNNRKRLRAIETKSMDTQNRCQRLPNTALPKHHWHQQNTKQKPFKIYPNPAGEFFIIETENESNYTLQIYNLIGKPIQQQTFTKNTQIDTQNWASGIYLLKITSLNGEVLLQNKPIIIT